MFNAFWSQASLFWLLTNHLDSRLLFAVLVDDVLLDLAKGLVVNIIFGSLSVMVIPGSILTSRWGFVYHKWSRIDLAILQTTKTWVDDK